MSAEPIILIEKRIPTFNPNASSDSAAERFRQLVFSSLMKKGDVFEPVPDICEKVETSPDAKTFKFFLRRDIKFHDGHPLSALDVKYTFETMLKDKQMVKGASFDQDLESIEAPEPYLVIFHCRNPFPSLLNDVIPVGIIPEGSLEKQAQTPVGTGPFKFEKYIDEQEVLLKANENYFLGAPNVERLRIKIVPDSNTRETELRKGSADIAINADLDNVAIESLKNAPGLKVLISNGTNLAHLGINLNDPVLKDVRIRRALAYAIDREAIIHDLLRDQAQPALSLLPPTQWAYNSNVTSYKYDPEAANKLLLEAGYQQTTAGQPRLKLTLKTSTLSIARKIGEAMQAQLRKVGIQLELQSLERQKLTQDMTEGNFQLYYNVMVGGNQSTDMFRFVYHSRSIPPNGQNRSRYNNPKLDALLDESLLASRERRQAIFFEVQKMLAEELPQIYLWYQSNVIVHSERIAGLVPDPSGDWRILSRISIK